MIDWTETYIITHHFWYEKGIDMGDGQPGKFENFPKGGGGFNPLNPPPGSASANDLKVLWIA